MNSILHFNLLLPIGLLVLQSIILLFLSFTILKRRKILKAPYSGMEYSQLIVVSSFLFGVFFISTGDISGLFQSFKTFQNAKLNVFSDTFLKFSQFFLVIIFFEILFALLCAFAVKLLLGLKNTVKELEDGDIPAAVLIAIIVVSFSIVLQYCSKEVIDYITPKYINFR